MSVLVLQMEGEVVKELELGKSVCPTKVLGLRQLGVRCTFIQMNWFSLWHALCSTTIFSCAQEMCESDVADNGGTRRIGDACRAGQAVASSFPVAPEV